MTAELSFRKNLCKYLGINALIQEYAKAEIHNYIHFIFKYIKETS